MGQKKVKNTLRVSVRGRGREEGEREAGGRERGWRKRGGRKMVRVCLSQRDRGKKTVRKIL